MVDSDDEFTELCSKLLKRVKKNKPEEPQEIPKPSAVTKNRLKKTKSSVARKQSGNGGRKRADQGTESGGNLQKANEKPSSSSSTERSNTEPQANVGLPNGRAQQSGDGSETARSQEMLSVKHLVLERMQQFKRAGPARMKLCSTEEDGTESLPLVAEALQDDSALNTALPMDLRGRQRSLEDEGLFFCQLCQKDLTALNGVLREQHVNRCLDHDESVSREAEPPPIPSCPLCGKSFNTEKSRASHLKRCAAKLDVPAHALLQAVQRQAAETTEPTTRVTQAKRKAGSKQKGPPKKRRVAQPGSEVEDLLVAMALSRSMQEDTAVPRNNSAPRATRPTENAVPVKKAHRKKKDRPAPLLLVQDPQAPLQRLHKRMSLLLSEESKFVNSIKLPPSRFWDLQETQKAAWSWPRQDEKLWEISNMVENIDPQHYYTRELNPPITPWRPPLKLLNSQPRTVMPTQPAGTPPCAIHTGKEQSDGAVPCTEGQHMSSSQKDRQALLDLAELAGEGMTFTQWNLGAGLVTNRTGRESTGDITSSGFVPSQEEEPSSRPPSTALQVALAADFAQMVNNPHLSDAQLQTDCGEVLNVHMFVLYARCPLLVEAVHSEGFWVDEASTGRVRRLLLNDVSAEAAVSFLRFLYSACTAIPARCLAHVCELARRFGVNILIDTCDRLVNENHSAEPQAVTDEDEDDGGARAETFQELLKSMWIEEEEVLAELEDEGLEEGKVDNEGVGEGELEEIYEFAATQRKAIEEQDTENSSSGETESRLRGLESEDSPVEKEELITKADSPLCTAWDSQVSVHTTPLPLTPSTDQVVKNVPLQNSPAYLANGNMESSPKLGPLAFPVNSPIKSSPGPQASQLPNASFPASSVSRQLFNESTPPRHHTSPGGRPTAFSTVSVNLSKSEDAMKHLCIQQSPLQFDDSYERMFSDTCGEYMEPSGISATGGCSASSPSGEQRRQLKKAASSTLPPLPQIGTSPDSPHYSLPSLASPPKSQPLSISSVTPPPKSLPCSLPSLPSPANSQPHSLPSLTSPANSQPRSLPSLTSPTNSQPRSLPSLTSPTNSQPRSLPSLTSPTNSQPCNLPSPSSPSCSQPLSLSSLASPLKSPLCHLPTLASPTNSQPCSLTSLASPPKSQTRNLPLAGSPTNSQPCSLPSSGPSPISRRCSQPFLESPPKPRPPSRITPNHGPSWQTTSSPCAAAQDPEVILILSSDDESEPSLKSADNPKSGEDNERNVSGGIRESPINLGARRSSEGFGHLEMSSCTETSWLVPATPLPNAAMSLTSQAQTSRLQLPSESTSVCIPATRHEDSVSPAKANSLLSLAQPTPKSSRDRVTSGRSSAGQQKTPEFHSSFISNGSRGPSSLPASPASSSVFEVGDSEDEAPLSKTQPETSSHSFYIDYEPPIHMEEELWFNGEETPKRPDSFPEPISPSPMKTTVIKSPEIGNNDNSVSRSPESVTHGETHRSPDLQSSRQSFLNSQLWDEWEEDERDDLPAVLPLAQRLNKIPDKEKELRTPVSIVRRRELAPKVPITPLPHYSDMDTPILKKELSRFGVRALPKKQMVLKLKEIFSYTHQVMSSDSEDEVPPSQRRRQDHGGTSQAPRYPAGTNGQTSPQAPRRKKLATVCGAKEAAAGEERPLTASQESTSSSAAASDTSSLSQSSAGNEFETAFADEEDDEPIAASQEAGRQAATTEAVRRFIGERPDLYKRILLYQPLELGAVQAELKQSGIKMAAGKLLDFLDAHCVTFTTAAARKEKKSRGRRKRAKRY